MEPCANCIALQTLLCANCAKELGHDVYECQKCHDYMNEQDLAPLVSPECIKLFIFYLQLQEQNENARKRRRTE